MRSFHVHGWDNIIIIHAKNGQMEAVLNGEKLTVHVNNNYYNNYYYVYTFCQSRARFISQFLPVGVQALGSVPDQEST